MRGRTAICMILLAAGPASRLAAGETSGFFLAREGKPAATIVVARQPTHAAVFAANELRDHVRRISGARLPIVSDAADVAGPRILVGRSAATERLGLDDDLKSQEYLIRFLPGALVLMGHDAPEPAPANVKVLGKPAWTEGKFGAALALDGQGAGLMVTDCCLSDEEGTLEAWVRFSDERQPEEATILRLDGSGPWTYHILRRVAGANRVQYITYDGRAGHSVASDELSPGWHHVMATWSAADGRMELFVDGKSCGSAKYVKTACKGAALGIGGIARSGAATLGNPLRGAIDEVRVSTVRRTPDASSYRGPSRPDGQTGLLLHFDEGKASPGDSSGRIRAVAPPPWCDEQGTSYAAHDFLERFCDVRWYGPTDLEMVYPKKPTLAVAPKDIRRRPAFALRCGHVRNPMPMGKTLWNHPSGADLRLFWARLRAGGEPYACNHSFYGYYDRYWKKNPKYPERFVEAHPDWFAKGYPGRPPQMCFTNGDFVEQVVRDARDYFDGRGAPLGAQARGNFFALVPMDNNSWCKCPACQARIHQDEKDHPHFTRGAASDYVFGFANAVAREVAKTHPDKFLSTIAYHDYAYYPRSTRLAPNISVMMCLHTRNWWAPAMEANDMKVYRAWVDHEKGRPLYIWAYYCFPEFWTQRGQFHCFPGFFAHTAARQIKMFAADGIRGVSTGGGLGEQVDTYVSFKLFDDPSLDVDELLDEFFTRYYGAAAEPMRRMYLTIEQAYSNPANYSEEVRKSNRHFHQTEEMAWKYLGTARRMTELGELMRQAERAARTGVEKQRVALFRQGVWQHMLEGRRCWLAKQKP